MEKLTGSQAILGGAVILSEPVVYKSSSDTNTGGITLGRVTRYILKIPFTGASWTTSVTTNFDTGKDIPAGSIVTDAWFDITTVGTSGTLTAGTNLDPDGFLTGIGIQTAAPQIGSVAAGGVTYGALLTDLLNTTSAAYAKVNYVATSAKSIAIGRSATTLTAGMAGNLYIEYTVTTS